MQSYTQNHLNPSFFLPFMDNTNVTFIILGATGDLAKRYLIPAIYKLVQEKKVERFAVVGVARRPMSTQQLLGPSKEFIADLDLNIWRKIEQNTTYHQLRFDNAQDYQKLGLTLQTIEKKYQLSGNRIFYLATLPEHFEAITTHLSQSGIAKQGKNTWSRLVYEKPFGDDLQSAKKINQCIAKVFDESQIYRMDHYLGKELVGNIALVRFTNRILEPLWNKDHLESVQIILSEKLGLEGRGEFYDKYGALKDVVQSHMLQMMALIGMESPAKITGDYIRNEKMKALKKIKVKEVILGQYDGFTKEEGVKPDSSTETFTALRLEIDNSRWKGVPFFLKTGKYLDKRETSIHLKFKMVECLLTRNCPTDSNYLTIRIQPNEGIIFEINAKVPGETYQVSPITMEFTPHDVLGRKSPQAYENLLNLVIQGDQSVFVRNDEIEAAWKIIDEIKKRKWPIYSYAQDSKGPKELEEWSRKGKVKWRS